MIIFAAHREPGSARASAADSGSVRALPLLLQHHRFTSHQHERLSCCAQRARKRVSRRCGRWRRACGRFPRRCGTTTSRSKQPSWACCWRRSQHRSPPADRHAFDALRTSCAFQISEPAAKCDTASKSTRRGYCWLAALPIRDREAPSKCSVTRPLRGAAKRLVNRRLYTNIKCSFSCNLF